MQSQINQQQALKSQQIQISKRVWLLDIFSIFFTILLFFVVTFLFGIQGLIVFGLSYPIFYFFVFNLYIAIKTKNYIYFSIFVVYITLTIPGLAVFEMIRSGNNFIFDLGSIFYASGFIFLYYFVHLARSWINLNKSRIW